MRVVAISDLHGNLPEVPECDLLIIAGDICPDKWDGKWAREAPHVQFQWLMGPFSLWANKVPAKQIIACWGNHDWIGPNEPSLKLGKVTFHTDELISVNGLLIWLTPWSPQGDLPRTWAFMRDDPKLERVYDPIPTGVVGVVVTHAPPYGFGDQAYTGGEHYGSKVLQDALKRVQPKHVICGHIHGGYGIYNMDGIIVHNVAIVDEAYRVTRVPTRINI